MSRDSLATAPHLVVYLPVVRPRVVEVDVHWLAEDVCCRGLLAEQARERVVLGRQRHALDNLTRREELRGSKEHKLSAATPLATPPNSRNNFLPMGTC